LVSFAYGLFILARTLLHGDPVPGFPTIATLVLFLGGLQLVALGVIGEYLARMFVEVKQRPPYLIAHRLARRSAATKSS
jgi:hypothetical protein